MPYANCAMMGSTTNSILIPNIPLLAKSWTNSSLLNIRNNTPTCHLFYILTLTNWRSYFFSHKTPLENELTFGNVVTYFRWLGAIFRQVFVIIIVETLDLWQVPFHLFRHWLFTWYLFLVIMRLQFTLAPLVFFPTFASTNLTNMVLLGDPISNFTFEVRKAFVLHALHHFHQTL